MKYMKSCCFVFQKSFQQQLLIVWCICASAVAKKMLRLRHDTLYFGISFPIPVHRLTFRTLVIDVVVQPAVFC